MTLDLAKLQQEVREWSYHNFGDQSPENPLIGLIEEVGELAHAYLKTKQKIRQIESGALEDAIGDIVIYYMDYTARIGFKMPRSHLNEFYGTAIYPIGIPGIGDAIGNVCNSFIHSKTHEMSYWRAGQVLTCLATFCKQNDLDFESAVTKTWSEVKQRDWKKFPKNGKTE